MKRFFLPLLIVTCFFLTCCNGSKVRLRGDSFSYDTQTSPTVVLPADGGPVSSFTDEPEKGFTMVIPLSLSDFTDNTEMLCIPGIVTVRLRQHNPKDVDVQNYPAGNMADGRCPVLEASLTLWHPSDNIP